jgi:hypothetical protein
MVLFPYYLYQQPLAPFAVKFAIKDLLPWSEIKPSPRYGNHNFPSHYGPFQMGIGIVFIAIMPVL